MFALKFISAMKKPDCPALRYWLFWALVIAGLAFGAHRYFEYRNAELDKRLERLR